MKSAGMSLAEHSSKPFDTEEVRDDTLILAISESVKEKLSAECGEKENIRTLNEFAGG